MNAECSTPEEAADMLCTKAIWGWLYDDQDVSLNTLCLLHFIQILYPLSHRLINKIMGEGRENNQRVS